VVVSPETRAKIEERWPSYAWLLNIPEIENLLSQAVEQEWAPDLFGSNLKATHWWRTRTETARRFADIEATDVATSHQMVNAQKVKVKELGASIGVTIDDETAGSIAWDYHRQGMNEGDLRAFIASRFKPAGAPAINVRAMADKWMVGLSDQQVDDLTRRMFTGEIDQAGVTAYMQTMATSQFPQLADMIAKGISPGDFFDPYKQMIAEMTDQTPDAIDLRKDPVWSRVISTADEKTGQIRPMSLNEAQKYIRGTDQFGNSRRGQAEAASFVTDFAQQLGLKR
jgi:hypothetical protein